MPTVDPNAVILTGENPFIRLSATDGGPNTTEASFWRITFSPGGPGPLRNSPPVSKVRKNPEVMAGFGGYRAKSCNFAR